MPPTKSKEKLTAHDKSILSRETILKWYRAKRLEKLRVLRDEIVSLSASKRDALKAKVIENTKKELASHKQSLTPAQREAKAKEFANALFRFALSKKDLADFAQKFESQSKAVGADTLYKYWLENNKDKKLSVIEESPQYLATIHLKKSYVRREAFLLLGIIEKTWGKEEALRIYKSCWKGDVFSLQPMWKYFTKEKAGSELGFYYGTRKIVFKPDFGWGTYIDPRQWGELWKSGSPKREYTLTGWWTVDYNEKSVNKYTSIKEIKKRLPNLNVKGDEWTHSKFLYKAIGAIKKELNTPQGKEGYNDSGLTPKKEREVVELLEKQQSKARNLSASKARKDIFSWFKKQSKNVWIQPSQEVVNLLSFAYGEGTGNYLYRYAPDMKRIYILPLQGADVKDKYFGGYLVIKNGKLGKIWHARNQKKTKEVMTKYIKTMSAKEINREIIDSRLKNENPEDISQDVKLKRTAGMVSTLAGVPKYSYYHKIDTDYYDVLEKKLKKALIKRKISKDRAEELARIRVRYMKDKIDEIIENDEILTEALDEYDKVKLEIVVNSKDEIKVLLADSKIKQKFRDARKKAMDAETSASSIEGGVYSNLEKKVEKYFGPAAPVVMWILDKFFKVKEAIGKLFTKKGSPVAGMVLGALGVKVSKEKIGSLKMNQSRFDKLLKTGRKRKRIKRKMYFGEDVTLKGKELIIPKGKGIILEKSMPVYLKGKGKFRAYPPQKKKGFSWNALVGRIGRTKYQYKTHAIVIEEGVTIPKGTIIPKGAKIKRIK